MCKRYGRQFALNELTLSIPRGRTVGILGPNGSGKSTLFRILVGLTRADSGTVTVLGEKPGWRGNQQIAYLPDRARWYREHTVQQAFTWAENLLTGFNREVANQMAEFMRISPTMQVSGMSRGQEARLMLILCIARRVPLIILDEPFAGIDVMSRERIIEGLIEHMSEMDATVLISTHELHEAEPLLDHAIYLDEGHVRLSGDADELRRQHGSLESIMKALYR
ncbi:MAG: ABC transporter ATP-binding protein [Alicyclobacillus sp.]|nr:ABC transporter ATP-binding protein [Alicyclobacillus sp.]